MVRTVQDQTAWESSPNLDGPDKYPSLENFPHRGEHYSVELLGSLELATNLLSLSSYAEAHKAPLHRARIPKREWARTALLGSFRER
jgi:hypothetical protein